LALLPNLVGEAHAQSRTIRLAANQSSARVSVDVGKSENVRTDQTFTELVVGDPEVADVVPLTDHSLSILGKKVGTTRVSVYAEGKKLVGVFDVEVSLDTSQLSGEITRQFPHARIRVSSANGRILLSGTAPDGPTVERAVTISKQFGQEVINSITVMQPQQVMLEVRFIEVARTAGRELGISWDSSVAGKDGAFRFGTANLLSNNPPFATIIGFLFQNGVAPDVVIQALEQKGMARRLAEPNLVALSGDTASFLAGGEFPFPVSSTLGQITIEFKRFGVGLAFTPTVLSGGLINMKIEPEVSQIDPNHTLTLNNITIPSLIVRRANTTIELRDGQSFAVAGLLQNNTQTTQSQLPWIGDVPVLGALFRSSQYQKEETDLAIIVTPHIVRPMRPGDAVRVPSDTTKPGNDIDFFLMGKAEVNVNEARETAAPGVPVPLHGHILDMPKGVVYVVVR
jgi:pilus assembly protein CpaC